MDVRNTRLGFDVGGPRIACLGDAVGGGKVEIDFQNNALNVTSGENKSTIMLRHAYFDVKNDDFRLLVGQTWDVISPLNPGMLLYSVGWDGGNIGYRRAQFRGERFLNFSDTSLVTAQLAIAPQVFFDNVTTTTPAATHHGRTVQLAHHRRTSCLDGRAARTGLPADHGRALGPHRRTGVRHDVG